MVMLVIAWIWLVWIFQRRQEEYDRENKKYAPSQETWVAGYAARPILMASGLVLFVVLFFRLLELIYSL